MPSMWRFKWAAASRNMSIYMSYVWDILNDKHWLVGGIPTPLKIWVRQLGWWQSQYMEWKVIEFHGSSHHQPEYSRKTPFADSSCFFFWLVLVLELNIGYAFFQCTGESSAKKAMFGHVHNQLLGVQLRQMSFTMVNPPPVIHNL